MTARSAPLGRDRGGDQLRPPPHLADQGRPPLPPRCTLAISDVVGDRPEDIGSGPTVADPTTVRRRAAHPRPPWPRATALRDAEAGRRASSGSSPATPTRLPRPQPRPSGSAIGPSFSASARARRAGRAGTCPTRPSTRRPARALISGGELTVTVTGPAEAAPMSNMRSPPAWRWPAATTSSASPPTRTASTARAARRAPSSPRATDGAAALAANDAASVADLFVTGPTGTNVNDLRIILVAPRVGA